DFFNLQARFRQMHSASVSVRRLAWVGKLVWGLTSPAEGRQLGGLRSVPAFLLSRPQVACCEPASSQELLFLHLLFGPAYSAAPEQHSVAVAVATRFWFAGRSLAMQLRHL